MKPRRETYVVTVTRPDGVSVPDMCEHIDEAVACWGGSLHPDDPLFGWAVRPVQVRRVPPWLRQDVDFIADGPLVHGTVNGEMRLTFMWRVLKWLKKYCK